jgi:hypothetical protein
MPPVDERTRFLLAALASRGALVIAVDLAANPRLDDCRRMPFFLIFVLEKTRASTQGHSIDHEVRDVRYG